jgi:predicted dehydrogenase
MTTKQILRVGMLSWAHVHAEFRTKALLEIPGVRVVAIADDNRERGEDAGRRWGVTDVYQDYRKLVERKDIDVIFVHSENNKHADQVEAAAEAGKDIFCEKPMATTLEDADRMLAAVKRNNVQMVVAFVSRFAKEAERAKRIVDTGVLGEIVSARSVIGLAGIKEIGCPEDMEAWMIDPACGGGGAWIDEGSHAVDLLRWMVGDVSAVSMSMTKKIKKHLAVEDEAVGILRFANGALGEVNTSWSLAIDVGMRNAIELYGSKGTLFLESTSSAPKVSVYTENLTPELRGWVTPHITPEVAEPHDYQSWPPNTHHYKREIASFVDRYIKGALPYGPSGEDGRACLAALLAGYRSAESGAFERV